MGADIPTRNIAGSLPRGQGVDLHDETGPERILCDGEQSEAATQSRVPGDRTPRQSSKSRAFR